ncbi:MAG: type II secretion system F family protein [Bdellovibrionaceae bacterium]|nr:type II secretion system F family protein [Pseudobdellovibrionaceae bacterium]
MSFANLSHFYRNFAELYSAGIDVASTVESLEKRSSGHDAHLLKIASHNLRKGRSLHYSFKVAHCVPIFDLPLVKAAEDSGRVVDVFKNLSQKHLDTHESIKNIRGSLIKPFFTFTAALMFPGVTDLFTQKITLAQYLKGSLGVLVLVCSACYMIYNYWQQSYFNIHKARNLYQIVSFLPFLNNLSTRIAIEKFSSTLAFMQDSSIDFYESLKQSAQCSANPKIQSAVDRIVPKIQNGLDLNRTLQSETVFPIDLVTAISLGSQSGKLPDFLKRYSEGLKKQNERTIQTMVKFFPIFLYWMVVGQIVYLIVNFYTGYLDQLLKIVP